MGPRERDADGRRIQPSTSASSCVARTEREVLDLLFFFFLIGASPLNWKGSRVSWGARGGVRGRD